MKRRSFITNVAAASSILIIKPGLAFSSKANSAIQIGFIGCGDRGTTVISSMSKNTDINIVAMADLFEDKLQTARPILNKLNADKGFAEIPASNIYQGSKAYLQLLQNRSVDAVLISSPAYTHPEFFEAAVQAGKHVYCEKPASVDVEGCKRIEKVLATVNGKLSVVIGFQIRYATPYVEMVKRIHNGDIGDVINVQAYYLSSVNPIKPYSNMSDDEGRIRNQFHFRSMSGGILLDQGIHMLDVCNWALRSHPISAVGRGNNFPKAVYGDAWPNYQVLYQYPENVNMSFHSTQFGKQFGDVCARFIGTTGIAEAHYSGGVFIQGDHPWDSGVLRQDVEPTAEQRAAGVFLSSLQDADANKEKAFISSIQSGKHLNEVSSALESTRSAILGRQAAETRKEISWDAMNASNEKIASGVDLSKFDKK